MFHPPFWRRNRDWLIEGLRLQELVLRDEALAWGGCGVDQLSASGCRLLAGHGGAVNFADLPLRQLLASGY